MLSELDLEDVEALQLEPLFLTADTLGPLLDHCEDALFSLASLEEAPTSRPPSPSSPAHSHRASLSEAKASELMLPWFGAGELLDIQSPHGEDDALLAMEWVSEKLELGELDLDSLLDSDCPKSPETQLSPCPLPDLSPLIEEVSVKSKDVKSEPVSPSPCLELGSEVDLPEKTSRSQNDCDSDSALDSGIESSAPHTPQSSSLSYQTTPYNRPQPDRKPPRAKAPKSADRKLKKMEQNKTAATRYRKKKRVEQEELNAEQLQLEQRNKELNERAQAISREIQYLKDLMEEVRRHHQSKKGTAAK